MAQYGNISLWVTDQREIWRTLRRHRGRAGWHNGDISLWVTGEQRDLVYSAET